MHRYEQGRQAAPPVGQDFSGVPNTADDYRLLTFRVQLLTSATVANRYPHFQFVTPTGDVVHEVVPMSAQVASTTITYDLISSRGSANEGSAPNDGVASLALPNLWFPANTRLRSLTTGLQVGDSWGISYYSALYGDEWEHLMLLREIKVALGG